MDRTKVIFFAFIGKAIEQDDKILVLQDGYECWNLKKFTLDEFVDQLKKKISPINNNVLRNYKVEVETKSLEGITEKQFEQCSWGLLIPDTLEGGCFNYTETLCLLNLYSPNFLYPYFYASDMGIIRQRYDKDSITYFHSQNHSIFQTKKFVVFYKMLFEQAKYGSWHLDRIQSWGDEDWRLFVVALLYSGLKDYENLKSSFGWQRESAEMATILEALLTAGDVQNEEVTYRLRKRIAVLLSFKFPYIEEEIKALYRARSSFVHGSFFKQIAKESPTSNNNIPTPNFSLLYKHKEYVRYAIVAYLNLARIIKRGDIEGVGSVMEALEKGIIDTKLRGKLILYTEELFDLMPEQSLYSV